MNILNYGADPRSTIRPELVVLNVSGHLTGANRHSGPGISERTLPGDRVAEPRWSFILEPGRGRKPASRGGGWAPSSQAEKS